MNHSIRALVKDGIPLTTHVLSTAIPYVATCDVFKKQITVGDGDTSLRATSTWSSAIYKHQGRESNNNMCMCNMFFDIQHAHMSMTHDFV